MKEHKNVVTKEIILKKKLLGLFLVASLALAPSLSSADQLVAIAQKAGYKEATETYRPKSFFGKITLMKYVTPLP